MKPRKPGFRPKFKGRNVFEIRVPRSGVSYSPEYHWLAAAAWAHYKTGEFLELDGELQSLIVAAYETHLQIEAVVAQEQARQMSAKAKARK